VLYVGVVVMSLDADGRAAGSSASPAPTALTSRCGVAPEADNQALASCSPHCGHRLVEPVVIECRFF
jgi:hypothetical protein